MYIIAGISVTVTKKNKNRKVLMFEDGNITKYAPKTPETAPLAPSIGILDPGVRRNCVAFPTIPAARYKNEYLKILSLASTLSPKIHKNHMFESMCKNPPCKNIEVINGTSV